MHTSASSYRLKRFQDSRDPDFAAALLLYVRNTSAAIRTDTNEITYWLDNFLTKSGDPFYVFGFYRDNDLVGYSEGAYFRDEKLLVLDYLVIDEVQRRNNVFFEFVDHLKRFLESAHPEYRYAVVEICYGPGQKYPSPESCLLTRLLKVQGFRVIRAPYYQPRLLLNDPESEMRADLLIYSTTNLDQLHTETYLAIVRTIYYRYYLPWQAITPDSPETYRQHLDKLYSAIQSQLGNKRDIVVNGHKNILATPPSNSAPAVHRVTVFSAQALAIIILLTAAMLGLKLAFKLSDVSFVTIYGLAVASFVAIAGIVSKNARQIFSELVSLAKHISRKSTSPTSVSATGKSISPRSSDKRRS